MLPEIAAIVQARDRAEGRSMVDYTPLVPSPARGEGVRMAPSPLAGEGWGEGFRRKTDGYGIALRPTEGSSIRREGVIVPVRPRAPIPRIRRHVEERLARVGVYLRGPATP